MVDVVMCRTKIFIRFPRVLFATEDALQIRKHDLGNERWFSDAFQTLTAIQYYQYNLITQHVFIYIYVVDKIRFQFSYQIVSWCAQLMVRVENNFRLSISFEPCHCEICHNLYAVTAVSVAVICQSVSVSVYMRVCLWLSQLLWYKHSSEDIAQNKPSSDRNLQVWRPDATAVVTVVITSYQHRWGCASVQLMGGWLGGWLIHGFSTYSISPDLQTSFVCKERVVWGWCKSSFHVRKSSVNHTKN